MKWVTFVDNWYKYWRPGSPGPQYGQAIGLPVTDNEQSVQNSKPPASSRRKLLILAGLAGTAAAAFYAWPTVQRLIPHDFVFKPLAWPPGFRRVAGGQISSVANPLTGIGEDRSATHRKARTWVQANPCRALFGPEPIPRSVVPIASFSDYNCPYCRVLSQILVEVDERHDGGTRIAWHEWPTLGSASHVMALAALAARRQGGYLRFHHSLMRTRFLPDAGYLTDLAIRKGLDPGQLHADMRSPAVVWEIARSTVLAESFGFRGTPALVVGRTAVSGAITRAQLEQLIEVERKAGPVPGCR